MRIWTIAGLVLGVCVTTGTAEELTYVDLVGRLTDLEALAVLPPPGEKCQQWSSYDRHSRYDAERKKYLDWGANTDLNGVIRYEGDTAVMAEMQGPGVIWRIWSAMAKAGHVQIYLDGSDQPAVDMPFINYFNGSTPPFTGPLTHDAAFGLNTYVPIPFAKSCKVVAQKDWGAYYHITYTTYPKGTVLPTFSMPLSPRQSEALAKANRFLATKLGSDPAGTRAGQRQQQVTATLQPGATSSIMEIKGPRAITALRVKLDVTQDLQTEELLRKLCLRMTWDDEPEAAVWSPLGDFFGNALGYRPYKSLPLGMTEDGFYSYWYMPFAKKAQIELINDNEEPVQVELAVSHAPLTRPIESLGRFHAKWHRDALMPADPQRRSIDWTMLKTQGRGRYVGVMLHVWNGTGGWWGEGDEKIFIDGEKFPSTFGTGSEDYFGYAWGNRTLFQHAYHNQTRSQGPLTCVNRWHISDNMAFQTSFEAAIEKYFPTGHVYYAATAYWYQTPGQRDGYAEAPVDERWGYFPHPPPKPPHR